MSEGRKPRRRGAVETDEAPSGPAQIQSESPVAETQPAPADEPSKQLSLIVFDPGSEPHATEDSDQTEELDESAELLVSVSSENLGRAVREGDEHADDDEAGEADTDARQAPHAPAGGPLLDQPGLEIRLARIHLRTGSLFMARAELEAIAAREQLDTAAHLDLAEARWRTGDIHGAGEAANAYLADGGGAALGFVIAAEAFAMANRHTEARQHAELALERLLSELDPVFAGMPRRAYWPAGAWVAPAADDAAPAAGNAAPAAAPPVEATAVAVPSESQVETAPERPAAAERIEPPATTPAAEAPAEEPVAQAEEAAPPPAEEAASVPGSAAEMLPVEAPAAEAPAVESRAAAVAQAEQGADAEVAAGRSFLEAGDPMMAALHFGVAIRLAPASAAAVLDAIGDRQDLPLQLVRGDALRLLGLEADAGNAYLSVASALGAGKPAAPEGTLPEAPLPEGSAPTEPPTTEPPPLPEPPSAAELPATEPPPLRWE